MDKYLQKILALETIQQILEFIADLTPYEVNILILTTATLIAVMIYRWFGIMILIVLLFSYLIGYVIFFTGFIDKFNQGEDNYNEHMREIESYMPGNEQ